MALEYNILRSYQKWLFLAVKYIVHNFLSSGLLFLFFYLITEIRMRL